MTLYKSGETSWEKPQPKFWINIILANESRLGE